MSDSADNKPFMLRLRVGIVGLALLAGAGIVTKRAYELQIAQPSELQAEAERQQLRNIRLRPARGTIIDRHGNPLAVSVPVHSVYANPRELQRQAGDPRVIARRLSALGGADVRTLERRLSSDRAFVWVARHVTPAVAAAVRDAALPGVHLIEETRRFYPNRELAAHVVGFANLDGEGRAGVERQLEEHLRGPERTVLALRDRRGHIVEGAHLFEADTLRGADVTLSIDKRIQDVAERELELAVRASEAEAGSVVVMDPHTGEILALANYPTFNPNTRDADSLEAFRNRAVTLRFEPGSTVKPFTVAAAIDRGVVAPTQRFDCEGGRWVIGERDVIHDSHPHEELSTAQILAFSSNIGTAKIALRSGVARIRRLPLAKPDSSALSAGSCASNTLRDLS